MESRGVASVPPQRIGLRLSILPPQHGLPITDFEEIVSPFYLARLNRVVDRSTEDVPLPVSNDSVLERPWPESAIKADQLRSAASIWICTTRDGATKAMENGPARPAVRTGIVRGEP